MVMLILGFTRLIFICKELLLTICRWHCCVCFASLFRSTYI